MAVCVVAGRKRERGTGDYSKQSFTQSTATAFQTISLFVDRVHFGCGTATGFTRNHYSLASGAAEGQEVSFLSTATGEAYLLFTAGTATGQWVFNEADDYMRAKYEDGKWRVLSSNATLATST
jgi:hypothetical protein